MTRREIQFWRKHRDQGTLQNALRADRTRAIAFFGAYAVFLEFEGTLSWILAAQATVHLDDEEVLAQMNHPLDSALAQYGAGLSPDQREVIEQRVRYELGDVAKVKREARAYLSRLFS